MGRHCSGRSMKLFKVACFSSRVSNYCVIFSAKSMDAAVRTAVQMADGYKDLVARRCEERGILFVPTAPPKYREGKHIYRCGRFHIYLDKSAILVQSPEGKWVPTSLNTLLDTAA